MMPHDPVYVVQTQTWASEALTTIAFQMNRIFDHDGI